MQVFQISILHGWFPADDAPTLLKKMTPIKTHAQAKKRQAWELLQTGQPALAQELYTEICREVPSDAQAWFLLGAAHGQQGHLDEVISCCQEAIRLQPDYVDAHYNLAQSYFNQRRKNEAISAYRRVLKLKPDYIGALINLGSLLQREERFEEAESCFRRATKAAPDNPDAHYNLGNALQAQGRFETASLCYRRAVKLHPDNSGYIYNLAVSYYDQGRHAEAIDLFRKVLELNPDDTKAYSSMLLAMNYISGLNPDDMFSAHKNFGEQHECVPLHQDTSRVIRSPDKRLKVGYVSPDLRNHSVAFFLEPLLRCHDREQVEVFCYANVFHPDNTTERLHGLSDQWRNIVNVPADEVAQLVARDDIDILVDLAGHTGGNRLDVFSHKPAPIQVTWLGYPNTTGLRTMDYRLTDDWSDPPGKADKLHTEKLIRVPQGFLCYAPPEATIGTSRSSEQKRVTFGSFNALSKINPIVISRWAEILSSVPDSQLLIKTRALSDKTTAKRLQNQFVNLGIAKSRIRLFGWNSGIEEHLALYGQVDVALDPFPYNGTTTTCEALWMGVPVVTLEGGTHAGRVGVSLLSQLGLGDMVSSSEEDYVTCAVRLAGDQGLRSKLRHELRERMLNAPLCNGVSFAGRIEAVYRSMWSDCIGNM